MSTGKFSFKERADLDLLRVAVLGKPFGVQGWIHLYPKRQNFQLLTEPQGCLICMDPIIPKDPVVLTAGEYTIQLGLRPKLKLKSVDSRDTAQGYVHTSLWVPRSQLSQDRLEVGQYYWEDLIGCAVLDPITQEVLGSVHAMVETAAHDLLIVRSNHEPNPTEILIPFIEEIFITHLDLKHKKIFVDTTRLILPPAARV